MGVGGRVPPLLGVDFGRKLGFGVEKLGSAVGKRFENMGKDDIAVEKRVSVVGKLGFALEERDSAVEGGLEIVVFPKSAVGEKGLAVEKGGVAVWKTALLTKK